MISELYVIEGDVDTWEEAIKMTSKELLHRGCVKDTFYESCIQREKQYPTGLTETCPVAMPHTTKEHVIKSSICVLKLKQNIKFYSMENNDKLINVKFVMNLAFLEDEEHIKIISKMICNLKNSAFIDKMNTLNTEELAVFLHENFIS